MKLLPSIKQIAQSKYFVTNIKSSIKVKYKTGIRELHLSTQSILILPCLCQIDLNKFKILSALKNCNMELITPSVKFIQNLAKQIHYNDITKILYAPTHTSTKIPEKLR